MTAPTPELVDLYPEQRRSGTGYSCLAFDMLCALWNGPASHKQIRLAMRLQERNAVKNCERIASQLRELRCIDFTLIDMPGRTTPARGLQIINRDLALQVLAGPRSNRGVKGNHIRVVPQPPELTLALQQRSLHQEATALKATIEREQIALAAMKAEIERERAELDALKAAKTKRERPATPVILPELQHEHSGTAARAAIRQAVSAATYGYRPPVLRAGALDALRHQHRHRDGGSVEQALGATAAAGR